jgi:hypothetical protein
MSSVVPLIHVQKRQMTVPFCVGTLPEEIIVLSPRSNDEEGCVT